MLQSELKVVTPPSLADALCLLREYGEAARVLAGGTDAMVRIKEGQWRAPVWLNIRRLPELTMIDEADGRMVVGAAVTYGSILRNRLLAEKAPLLAAAAADVGSVQIQAMGTLGGNLGTASPAGDALPPLVALDAEVGLQSTDGQRWVPVEQFLLGPGKTARRPDELITAVRFAPQEPGERWNWQKLGLRGAQAISIVSLALRYRAPGFARIAYGAVGPTVLRARKCEAMLAAGADAASVSQMAWKEVLPISDVRASAEYRQQMACALLERALREVMTP
ncbi:MAG TPA: FAD binding domain-containing protein [Symbiobacteriaceae bacterium]|nr:FAD binding domain-containing protein [Symbiobacteriaceae bacterium]